MGEMKKGADTATPAPSHKLTDTKVNYNRANSLCLGILLICITVFLFAYYKSNEGAMTFCLGGITASGLVLVALNPIREE